MFFKKGHENLKSFQQKFHNFLAHCQQRPIKLNVWYIMVNYWKHLCAINDLEWNRFDFKQQIGFSVGFQVPNQFKVSQNLFKDIDEYIMKTFKVLDVNRPYLRVYPHYLWFKPIASDIKTDVALDGKLAKIASFNEQIYQKLNEVIKNRHTIDRQAYNVLYFDQPIAKKYQAFINYQYYKDQNLALIYQPVKIIENEIVKHCSWSLLFKQLLANFALHHPEVAKWTIVPDLSSHLSQSNQDQSLATNSAMLINVSEQLPTATNIGDPEIEDYLEAFQILSAFFVKKVNLNQIYKHYKNVIPNLKALGGPWL